jgi:general secretion pathway protein H
MRTSAIGIRPRPSPGRPRSAKRGVGFTLIELLVVIAIIGVVTAVAAVNLMPSDAELARREAGLLALSIEKARDAAWFGGRPTAVSFEDGRLRQWRLGPDRTWQPDPSNDRPLGEAQVTALHIEGEALATNQRLIFLSDGFVAPFRVALEIRGVPRAIEGDAAGALVVRDK